MYKIETVYSRRTLLYLLRAVFGILFARKHIELK